MIKKVWKNYKESSKEIKATFWFVFANIFQKGIGTITVPIFTRIMTAEEYGVYSIYLSWYYILIIFATLNLSYYVFNNGLIKFENDKENLTLSLQSLGTIITITIWATYWIFRKTIENYIGLNTIIMNCMFLQFIFTLPIGLWSTRQRFDYNYIKLVLLTVFMSVLNPTLGIIMIKYYESGAKSRVFSITIVTVLFGLFIYVSNIKKAKKVVSFKYWKYALKFNLPLIPHFLSTILLNQSDRIMINNYIGTAEAGIYSVAYSAGTMPLLLNNAIHQSILPWLYRKLKYDNLSNIGKVFNVLLIMVGTLILIVIAFTPEIISIFAPKTYYNAIWIIPPVAASVFFMFLYNLYVNIEYYYEETIYVSLSTMAVAIINIVMNHFCLQIFGYIAAAYTTLICYILFALFHYIIIKRLSKKYKLTSNIFNHKLYFLMSVIFIIITFILMFLYNYTKIRMVLIFLIMILIIINSKKIISNFKILIN